MSVRIKSKDGSVSITADDSSVVKNIVIDGEDVTQGPYLFHKTFTGVKPLRRRQLSNLDVAARLLVYTFIVLFCGACWAIFFKGCVKALAHASPLDCETIKSSDWKNFCRAETRNDPTWCELIKDKDVKQRCRAAVRK